MEKEIQKIASMFHGKQKFINYYLAGFADAECSFSVAIIKHPMQKFGWMINPCFQVYQHQRHKEILEFYKFVFGTGSIYRKSGTHPVLNFSIDSRRNLLEKVIPFFERYPLVVKHKEFKKFKEILQSMERKEHLTKKGFIRLVKLAYSMNQQGKGRKHTLEELLLMINNQFNQKLIENPQRPTSDNNINCARTN
jgi:hypothetical protein